MKKRQAKKKPRSTVPPRGRGVAAREQSKAKRHRPPSVAAVPVTARELRTLKRELERRLAPSRWNPDPEDVQKSVAQLVLTIVEFLRKLMERQAIRRMEAKSLTPEQTEAVGLALMRLEETVTEIGKRFGLTSEDLNLDLGPIKLM